MAALQLTAEHCGLLHMQATEAVHPVHIPDLGEPRTGTVALHQPELPEGAIYRAQAQVTEGKDLSVTQPQGMIGPSEQQGLSFPATYYRPRRL